MAETKPVISTSAEHWRKITKPYCGADDRRSALQLLTAASLFIGAWASMIWSLQVGYWLTLLLAVPTATFTIMLFMIQHDCGHGSYFKSRALRDAVGFCIGVITLTPYQYWRRTHAYHHSHSGDLDFRGFGDIRTATLAEYMAMTPKKRFAYRVYRNPLVLLTIGPAFHFIVKHRFPWDIPKTWTDAWRGVWMTNAAMVAILVVAHYTIGLIPFLMIQVPVSLIACSIGVFLFYVQHQYEESYWHEHKNWNYFESALRGSSHLVLPRPLQWLTANIGIHHVHHLDSQIPNYKLEDCLDANPELQVATKITMKDAWRLFNLTLWDEKEERMISFRDLRNRMQTA